MCSMFVYCRANCALSLGYATIAQGQFELNWEYDDALVTADRQTFMKYMVKEVAERHGMKATFMPKPIAALTGNGAHCHVTVHDLATGENLFKGDDEMGCSPLMYKYIGGIMHHAK